MADVLGQAVVEVLPDVKRFSGELGSEMKSATRRVNDDLKKVSSGWGKTLRRGIIGGLGVGIAQAGVELVRDFARGIIDGGRSLEAAIGAVNQVFAESRGQIQDWAKTTAASLGVSRTEALGAVKNFGALFKSVGITDRAAAGLSTEWVKLSANLAAFGDTSPTDALQAMEAALRGELDPLQRFVPALSAATIEQRALGLSGKQTAKELTQQDKVLALNALLLESTANKAGAAERAQGGLGVQTNQSSARFKDMQAQLGTALVPLLTKLGQFLNTVLIPALTTLAAFVDRNSTLIITLAAALGGLVLVLKTVALAQLALNVVMLANPIVLVVAAVAALVAAFIVLWNTSAGFRDFFISMWNGIKAVANAVVDAVVARWTAFTDFFGGLPGRIAGVATRLFTSVRDAATSVARGVTDVWNGVVDWFRGLPGRIVGAVGDLGGVLFGAGRAVITGLWNGMKSVWDDVQNWASAIGPIIGNIKGPLDKDKKLLIPAGRAIMAGLQAGLLDGFGPVAGLVSGMAGRLGSRFGAPGLLGTPTRVGGIVGTTPRSQRQSAAPTAVSTGATRPVQLTIPVQIGAETVRVIRAEIDAFGRVLLRGAQTHAGGAQ